MRTSTTTTNCCVCNAKFRSKAPHPDEIKEFTVKYVRGWGFTIFPGIPDLFATCGRCLDEFAYPVGRLLERAFKRGRAGRFDA